MKELFKNITDLSFQRNWKQAIAFYFTGLLFCFLLGAIGGVLASMLKPDQQSAATGGVLAVLIFLTIVSILIIKNKKLTSIVDYICVPVAIILILCAGGLGGMIPIAYLSTRPKKAVL